MLSGPSTDASLIFLKLRISSLDDGAYKGSNPHPESNKAEITMQTILWRAIGSPFGLVATRRLVDHDVYDAPWYDDDLLDGFSFKVPFNDVVGKRLRFDLFFIKIDRHFNFRPTFAV